MRMVKRPEAEAEGRALTSTSERTLNTRCRRSTHEPTVRIGHCPLSPLGIFHSRTGPPNAQYLQCPIPNAQYPMPNAQYPMPNTQCPIPNAQCPMPNAQWWNITRSWFKVSNTRVSAGGGYPRNRRMSPSPPRGRRGSLFLPCSILQTPATSRGSRQAQQRSRQPPGAERDDGAD